MRRLRAWRGRDLWEGSDAWSTERRWVVGLLGVGVVLRVFEYLSGRGLWLDETFLLRNITEGPTFALFGRLNSTQVVPPLFLLVERVVARGLGLSELALRIAPLLAGIASVFLFRAVSRRVLTERGALIALALFALSDELIYYAVEIKPYGSDVTVALAIVLGGLVVREGTLTARSIAGQSALGVVAVGYSFTSIFVLAAVGTVLAVEAIADRQWRRFGGLSVVGACWLGGFGLALAMSRSQIGTDRILWNFWDFAFPPSPWVDPAWLPRRLLFLFVSPLDYHGPLDPRLSVLPAVACAIVGLGWLIRRRPSASAMLVLPGVLTLLAAALRLYPFHGRLVMHLFPTLLLAIAAGVDRLRMWSGSRAVGVALLTLVLANPVWLDLYHLSYTTRVRSGLNPHGDRRPEWMIPDMFGTTARLHPPRLTEPAPRRRAGTPLQTIPGRSGSERTPGVATP